MTRLKVEISVPESHVDAVIEALHQAGAGRIGAYDRCTTFWRVSGTWRPLPGSTPYDGEVGEVQRGEEFRVEALCDTTDAVTVRDAVRAVHPYEEAVIVFLPVYEPVDA